MRPVEEDAAEAAGDHPVPAPAWPPEELVLKLRKPVTDADGSEIRELRLREPTDSEWVAVLKQEPSLQRRHLVSAITSLPLLVVAKVAIGDLMRAESYLFAFFEMGQAVKDW